MKSLLRFIKVREAVTLAVLLVALAFLTMGGSFSHRPFASSELRFAEPSKLGMQIIPASCPSDPHYSGECSGTYSQGAYGYSQGTYSTYSQGTYNGTCTAQYYCSASDLYYRDASCTDTMVQTCADGCSAGRCNAQCNLRYYCSGDDLYYGDVTYSYCQNNKVQTCGYGCSGSACLPPPSPTATISARPSLVRENNTSDIIWSSAYTTTCSVTGDNGDSWPNLTSGTRTSKPIIQLTTYTLRCTGEDGSTITATASISIIPNWQEQ